MLDDFDYQVCTQAYKETGSTTWDDKIVDWFYRMDFNPSDWKKDYLTYLKSILSK